MQSYVLSDLCLDFILQDSGLTMANEAPEKSFPTVCGDPECRCSRIMVDLLNSRTPFFIANKNFTRKTGPGLPVKFVQQHGHEMAMLVTLETTRMAFGVELVVGIPGKDDSVRFGEGWESFMINAKFYADDLLFFTLRGQSRFVIVPVRGHNRRRADAEPEPPKGKVKYSEGLLSDVLEARASSPVKSAAKQQKPGQTSKSPVRSRPLPPTLGSGEGAPSQEPIPVQDLKTDSKPANDPGKQFVTQVSSYDTLESYMPLLESSDSGSEDTEMEEPSGEFEEDRSDYEDETEFKIHHRTWERRGAR